MKIWLQTAALNNHNRKRQQQNNGKVNWKESANKPSSAEKKVAIIGDSMVKSIKHYYMNKSKSTQSGSTGLF